MNEYKEFQITLPSGEIIRRNSEGMYGSNNIVVDKDYVIDTLVQSHQEQGKDEMKFYETHEPYYALIKARNIESAMEIYNNDVSGGDEKKELAESIKEVTALYQQQSTVAVLEKITKQFQLKKSLKI
ncbi:hypothetical protein P5485_014690 [Bacillus pumilus]|uniref:Uncharacterized protein n=1 Tax=Bacillus altitudinis TaxID=293387 RepID=A0A653VPK1_BACAB|nr:MULTISPECIES: hypothetical protein [Bacillus]AMM98454.1 hypothetical protein UP12_14355 [Bacillus pumilus]MDH3148874.1 hypothetical protein [Bacillus pumilus]MDM5164164.1 hypothetical protein [Bacillus altitudinis]VXC03457.1 hypothetical protein BACI348_50097 [Bacillus altitudinis]